uniref:Uncharacterized protein n=1 Tax=Arundo donax TaxID=35708 RepID=A0A0A9B3T2_ARUDO
MDDPISPGKLYFAVLCVIFVSSANLLSYSSCNLVLVVFC